VKLVLLDWTGGLNPIHPDKVMRGLDFSAFQTVDGGSLADAAERFQEDVRAKVSRIFCDDPELSVVVQNGEDTAFTADTVVHLTQETPPNGGTDIGEGEYDPCDRQNDNAALVYGERLRQLSGPYGYEEWVNVFANVCAHEVGHTLGFGHVERTAQPDIARSLYVELMLDRHTMAEMRREQRLVVEQTNCAAELLSSRAISVDAYPTAGHDAQP